MAPRSLRIITRLNVGGPATHVVLADRGLMARGWETLLVYGSIEPDEAEVAIPADLATRSVPTMARPIHAVRDARAALEIGRIIRQFRPHIIHTHLSKAGLIGRAVAELTSRSPRVHTFHGTVFAGYFGDRANGAIILAERLLARRTAAILALSGRQQEELIAARVGDPTRIHVVPLGLDLARFGPDQAPDRDEARRALGIESSEVVYAAIGRLVPIKRLGSLLTAFAEALPQVPSARLVLVGDGGERETLERQVTVLGIAGRTSFAGWSSDTPRWYAAADVICLTSEQEGTPLALIEAAAAARPVIATDVGGVADVVIDGVTGMVVPFGDDDAFARAMVGLGTDPGLRQRLGSAAPSRAIGFAADRLTRDLDELYRGLMPGRFG